ncbi:hypothetical protein Tco_0237712 [Tanacetum coccineum]
MGIGVTTEEVDLAASSVGCYTFSHPFSYLGVKVGSVLLRLTLLESYMLFFIKHQYPRFYALESHKQISVATKMRHASFYFSYRRAPRGGVEQKHQLHLLSRMTDLLLPHMLDRWVWSLEALGDFSMKSVCNLIDDMLLPKEELPTRWVNVIPIKINVFAWRLRLNKLLCG